jgi:hypothetical protein
MIRWQYGSAPQRDADGSKTILCLERRIPIDDERHPARSVAVVVSRSYFVFELFT